MLTLCFLQGRAGELNVEVTLMARSRDQASDDEEFDAGVHP
jgi:hypothetical protein